MWHRRRGASGRSVDLRHSSWGRHRCAALRLAVHLFDHWRFNFLLFQFELYTKEDVTVIVIMGTFEDVNFGRDGRAVGGLASVVSRMAYVRRLDEQRADSHVRFGIVLAFLYPVTDSKLDHLWKRRQRQPSAEMMSSLEPNRETRGRTRGKHKCHPRDLILLYILWLQLVN